MSFSLFEEEEDFSFPHSRRIGPPLERDRWENFFFQSPFLKEDSHSFLSPSRSRDESFLAMAIVRDDPLLFSGSLEDGVSPPLPDKEGTTQNSFFPGLWGENPFFPKGISLLHRF